MTLNLTQTEALTLYGFMEMLMNKVDAAPDLELIDRENTTALITGVMKKIADELENQRTNN